MYAFKLQFAIVVSDFFHSYSIAENRSFFRLFRQLPSPATSSSSPPLDPPPIRPLLSKCWILSCWHR